MQWAGQQAVVTFPRHIDCGNVGQIRERLLWIINRGAAVLIADLTGTLSCDYSGADALARAHHRAVANGTEVRAPWPAPTTSLSTCWPASGSSPRTC